MKLYIEVTKRTATGRFIDLVEFTDDLEFIKFVFETFPEKFAYVMYQIYWSMTTPFDSRTDSCVIEHNGDMYAIARHWWNNESLYVEEPEDRIVSI